MAFLVIEKDINKTVKQLKKRRKAQRAIFKKSKEESDNTELKETADKLRCAESYQSIYNQRSFFRREVAHLKIKHPIKYTRLCREAVRGIIGINFDKEFMQFRVRIRHNGSLVELGRHNSPSSAMDALNAFLN